MIQRRSFTHLLERLADAPAELAREIVDCVEQLTRRVDSLTKGGELISRIGGDQADGDDIAVAQRRQTTGDNRAYALALRDLTCERDVDSCRRRSLHSNERGGNR